MDFSLSDEQQMVVKTTREFVINELYPHEKEVEETGVLREDLHRELKAKAIEAGLYAANMPVDVGGAGVVQVVGGLMALSVAWIAGPRRGKYSDDGMATAIPGHLRSCRHSAPRPRRLAATWWPARCCSALP